MENKKIIEKIKKLLQLAKSPNENEAKAASAKAQALLMEHNLSMATVEGFKTEDFDIKKQRVKGGRRPVEAKFINSILGSYFFVTVLYSRFDRTYEYIGTKENVEIALYVKDFLSEAFKRLYKETSKAHGWAGKNRNAFYLGLYKGLDHRLEMQKEAYIQADTGNALMIVEDALAKFVSETYPNMGKGANRAMRLKPGQAEAMALGYQKGTKLNISKGLASQSTQANTLKLN